MSPDPIRALLVRLSADRGISYAAMSKAMGRNPAYMHQFIHRGSPEKLDDDARLALAQLLDLDERLLGARDPWSPKRSHFPSPHRRRLAARALQKPRISAVLRKWDPNARTGTTQVPLSRPTAAAARRRPTAR